MLWKTTLRVHELYDFCSNHQIYSEMDGNSSSWNKNRSPTLLTGKRRRAPPHPPLDQGSTETLDAPPKRHFLIKLKGSGTGVPLIFLENKNDWPFSYQSQERPKLLICFEIVWAWGGKMRASGKKSIRDFLCWHRANLAIWSSEIITDRKKMCFQREPEQSLKRFSIVVFSVVNWIFLQRLQVGLRKCFHFLR